MSPRHTYTVELLLGRTLSRVIDADSPETALKIAEYLHEIAGDRYFDVSSESIVDSYAHTKEGAGQ